LAFITILPVAAKARYNGKVVERLIIPQLSQTALTTRTEKFYYADCTPNSIMSTGMTCGTKSQKDEMKKCKCGKPTEADRYNYCYDCWWSQDPRNPNRKREMKRYFCDTHYMSIGLGKGAIRDLEKCSICRYLKRPATLKDIARDLERVAESMRFAHEHSHYDPHGITYARDFEKAVIRYLKAIHKDYRKNFITALEKEVE